MEKGYMISDASKLVQVENHVLRYWEEELCLPIPRNEMGHRYYRESDIRLLRRIKDLKEQGFQLRAIKKILPEIHKLDNMDSRQLYRLREELNNQVLQETLEKAMGSPRASVTSLKQARYEKEQKEWKKDRPDETNYLFSEELPKNAEWKTQSVSSEKLRQFEEMMKKMIRSAMKEISQETENHICKEVTLRLQKEVNYLFLQKEELQQKQLSLLQEILQQVRQEKEMKKNMAFDEGGEKERKKTAEQEVAATEEVKEILTRPEPVRKKIFKGHAVKERKKKSFAKSL